MTTAAELPPPAAARRRPGGVRGDLRLVRPAAGAPLPRSARSARSALDEGGRDGGVKSVTAALDVLDCFIDADELGVSDIARRLGVAKSTAHRLLTSLCARGLADKNPETGQYRLGLHLFELGQLAGHRMRLRRTAMPLLEELRQASGCTVHLAVASGTDVLYLERMETLKGMQLFGGVGRRLPSHCTSSGKVIAAYDSDFARARKSAGFPALTDVSIRTAVDYERALIDVRRRGVATNMGEALAGLASVAAPVLDASGRAQAAISLVGPAQELASDFGRPARLVTIAARRLARSLGI
jgi:DNA-binding IclR family transcriptional regulator